MWQTWQVSQSLRKSPSDLLGIKNSVHRYYFDKAVWRFGSAIEADLNAVAEKSKTAAATRAKQAMVMAKWMGAGKKTKGLYRDPARSS